MRTLMPTLPSLQNEINRIFEGFFSRMGEGANETLSDWAPRVDVVEDTDTVRIYADLPGLNRDDINVSVERLALTITGQRKQPENADKLTWHRATCRRNTKTGCWGSRCTRWKAPNPA